MQSLLPNLISKTSKTIAIQRLDTQQSIIIQIEIDLLDDNVDLSPILSQYCPLQTYKVQLYDPSANAFLTLRGNIVSKALLEPTFIFLRFGPKPIPHKGSGRELRSKQRNIGEIIDLVRRWRELHETRLHPQNRRKKLSLPQAANILGVSKKSLDDYYCQLRIAEQHGFDFETHLHDGVGVLRAFVKNKKQQKITHKHPKILRLIEDIPLQIDPPKESQTITSQTEEIIKQNLQEQRRIQLECPRKMDHSLSYQKDLTYLQQEYYQGFKYLLDEPIDPFLNLNRNFSFRISDDQSNSILFF